MREDPQTPVPLREIEAEMANPLTNLGLGQSQFLESHQLPQQCPGRRHANAIGRFRDAQNMQPSAQIAQRNTAPRTIFLSHINLDERILKIKLRRRLKLQIPRTNVALVFGRTKIDAHSYIVCTI